MEQLVPLSTTLFPPALVIAFGLPASDGGARSRSRPSSPKPILAPPPEHLKHPVSTAYPTHLTFQSSNWTLPIQHKPILQQPTTSGSSCGQIGRLTNNYGMYMQYPPAFASSLQPGVLSLFSQPKGNGTVAEYSSLSFSGGLGQQYSGGGGGGVRMAISNAATTTMTDTTDEDQGDGARAVKRARLVWTPQLHKRFEEAVAKLGHEKSIPKNIMQEMNVEGLTRENVASHLQKFRLIQKGGSAESGSYSSDKDKGAG